MSFLPVWSYDVYITCTNIYISGQIYITYIYERCIQLFLDFIYIYITIYMMRHIYGYVSHQICHATNLFFLVKKRQIQVIASEAKWASASERRKPRENRENLDTVFFTSRKAVSWKQRILDIWCWEQKVFVLTQLVDIWSEPARPGPARPNPARPSRFWEAYNSETVDYTEKCYQT